jgi:hypothetical protein
MNLPRTDNSAAHRALVRDCLRLLSLRGAFAWDNQMHGHYDPRLKRWIKPKGATNGTPDISGFFGAAAWPWCAGVMVGCEIKTGTGKLTPEQKAFLDLLNANGGLGVVIHDTVAPLDAALTAWGRREKG